MQMSLTVDAVRSDVAAIGELGDETVADVAERIAALLARALPARLLELLTSVAADVSAELPEGRLEVRVRGDDVDLVYVDEEPGAPSVGDDELSARISLRLSEGLKARVEDGAGRESLSVNSYIVRLLERGTSQRPRVARGGTRIRGYGST